MPKPSLTVETFVAALALLGAGTSIGCSKGERATAAPEAPVGASSPSTLAIAPDAAPAAQPDALPGRAAGGRDDDARKAGGASVTATAAPSPAKPEGSGKSPSASCGAGGCTPDMKKGNGN